MLIKSKLIRNAFNDIFNFHSILKWPEGNYREKNKTA
jgi:hypothetical protein